MNCNSLYLIINKKTIKGKPNQANYINYYMRQLRLVKPVDLIKG